MIQNIIAYNGGLAKYRIAECLKFIQMDNRKNERLFCQTRVCGSAFFSAFDLKKATKITLFEKICLWFIKPKIQVDEIENNTLVYKIFRGKMYIINHFINPPKQWNCRHSFVRR